MEGGERERKESKRAVSSRSPSPSYRPFTLYNVIVLSIKCKFNGFKQLKKDSNKLLTFPSQFWSHSANGPTSYRGCCGCTMCSTLSRGRREKQEVESAINFGTGMKTQGRGKQQDFFI